MESPASRRKTMQAVKARDTSIELRVRRILHSEGYRYRIHDRTLPGKPDIVFRPRKKTIFINGCFWHGHECARGDRPPKSNAEYWSAKLARNRERDRATAQRLEQLGWQVLTVWECELRRDFGEAMTRIKSFLGPEKL